MEGRFLEVETGAEYYVRELPDGTVAWVGELPSLGPTKAFTNVFWGRRVNATLVEGDLMDIPKGVDKEVYRNLRVHVTGDGFFFDLPGPRRRTFRAPDSDLPINDWREWGAGFYDEGTGKDPFLLTLTGVWKCNDGGTYYIRQVGNDIVWFGEHPGSGWSNVFNGQRNGDRVSGRWMDVPKGVAHGSGTLEFTITSNPLLNSLGNQAAETILEMARATGGFGGRTWHKTDSLRIAFRLNSLQIISNADVGGLNPGGDEPYLMPVYITLGGNQYRNPVFLTLPEGDETPDVVSPLFSHEWGTRGDWPKNNLTWQENLLPGTILPIPDFIAYGETELRTLPDFQPNSNIGRTTANFVPGVIAMEEASTRNEDMRTGLRALLDNAPRVIQRNVAEAVNESMEMPDLNSRVENIRTALVEVFTNAARSSATADLFGILGGFDPDKEMGANFPLFSIGRLRRDSALANASIPIEMVFTGGAGGRWVASGSIFASLGPVYSQDTITALEITLETGDDDKREDSMVEFFVETAGGRLGPFRTHRPGTRFPDRTLHVARINLATPVHRFNFRALAVRWARGRGDGWSRSDDSWKLQRIRVTGFNRFNRRFVILGNHLVNTKLEGNRTLSIPLPRA
jgi:hypothetical protein